MKVNYHTHNKLCGHASGSVEDYVKEAIKNNLDVIGISDHGPIPIKSFYRMSYDAFINDYLKQIDEAKEKYKDKIKIYAGLEIEYVYGFDEYFKKLKSKLDYLILGPHYFSGLMHADVFSSAAVTDKNKLTQYVDFIIDSLDTGFFEILAHPDIFMFNYPSFDEYCEKACRRIVESCIKNDVVLEINANGIRPGKIRHFANGEIDYRYPNKHFWEIVSEYKDVKVIASSDCHSPEILWDENMERAIEYIKIYNLNEATKIVKKR